MKPDEPVAESLHVSNRPPPLPLVQRLIVRPRAVVIAHVPSPPGGELVPAVRNETRGGQRRVKRRRPFMAQISARPSEQAVDE
jgi:hypothetical protein